MGERTGSAGGGFSVLDGVALVAGAAVASVHLRVVLRGEPAGAGWVLLGGTFVWVAVTAAGPFVYLVRRHARRLADHPKLGDRLWALLGLPWLITALLQTRSDGAEPPGPLIVSALSVGLGVASLVALAVVWTTWVMVPPTRAAETFAAPWTNRVGLFLAVAWPLQCGVGMVVIG